MSFSPRVVLVEGYGGETGACSFCCRPDGTPVRKAKRGLQRPYRINGAACILLFPLCELCSYARTIFPAFDTAAQALAIDGAVRRMNQGHDDHGVY